MSAVITDGPFANKMLQQAIVASNPGIATDL